MSTKEIANTLSTCFTSSKRVLCGTKTDNVIDAMKGVMGQLENIASAISPMGGEPARAESGGYAQTLMESVLCLSDAVSSVQVQTESIAISFEKIADCCEEAVELLKGAMKKG